MKKIQYIFFASMLISVSMMPLAAIADLNVHYSVTSAYLFRGDTLSDPTPAVSGGIDYDSGLLYAGFWTSSEGPSGSQESDVYVGLAGATGMISYDVGLITYYYPRYIDESSNAENSSLNVEEVYGSIGYSYFTLGSAKGITTDENDEYLYNYLTISGAAFTATYGVVNLNEEESYNHLTLDYAATDKLSLSVNFAMDDESDVDNDPIFAVTYSESFDL